MDHDTKKKRPDKKQEQLTEEDFGEDSWFSLIDALSNPGVSVGALATFIDKEGVKVFDRHGNLITATDGEEQEPTSKARALNLLALYYKELRDCADLPPRAHPPQDPDRWLEYESPLNEFGWSKDEVSDDPDDFAKWIANPISENETNSSVTTKDTNLNDLKEEVIQIPDTSPTADVKPDYDKKRSDLFDPVTVKALENMFPADGKWKGWAERAKRNGLIAARRKRGMFNPYEAAMWFKDKNIARWDLARCNRVLANNLPARFRYEKHLFTNELD